MTYEIKKQSHQTTSYISEHLEDLSEGEHRPVFHRTVDRLSVVTGCALAEHVIHVTDRD